ncbi:MAG TPA: KpsF/GutQ family sugar-phosphate isomerase [Candidatus Cloacimonadota bacterium]|nr:KpsF/GutQ family sugar-phosphate isomerase [Candidatus Cloacimonadota bacterium]HPT71830.1 KpsF/GutQ family sugar-phosphate isomerase [Candidatus Cloacimonadota bacterium]
MNIIELVKQELNTEADAIRQVAERIDASIVRAFDLVYDCKGKVVVTGMGKAGIIARKIAATLASTGTLSIFLHAAEGIHGDIGMVEKNDVVIAISNSGNTNEITSLIPYFKFLQIPVIAFTGNLQSELAQHSDVVIDCSVPLEYEPFGLVPTASTTVALAVGDALAIALMKKRNFQKSDFARFHPGGAIGRKMLLRIEELMHKDDEIPVIRMNQSMSEAIVEMTGKRLGCTCVIDHDGLLTGFITDGDLRRLLQKESTNPLAIHIENAMTVNPKAMKPSDLAVEALNLMEKFNITMLPIVDDAHKPVGVLHMHDLIKAGIVS